MQRTKILATQEVIGIAATTAINVSTATLVRLHNNTTGIVTVGIATTAVGAATTSYFSMPAGSVEFIEKTPSQVMWATAAINANKVGFTN